MTLPGPGDPETWPAPTGHPNDPRTPDPVECPDCGELIAAAECECGWSAPEPDYEAMLDDDPYDHGGYDL